MRNGFRVFDADAHVVEPRNLWERFLDAKHRGRVGWRQPIPGRDSFRPATVDGRYTQSHKTLYGDQLEAVRWTKEAMVAKYGDVVLREFDGPGVVGSMAPEGIDLMVLYGPGYDMWVDPIDGELQAAMARAYNRWGAEMHDSSGGRLIVSAPVPLADPARAVEEIRYAHERLGARCFWARPNAFQGRTLGDRLYDPIWEVIQDLDCAFATHDFMGLNGPSVGSDRFESFTEWHTVCHPYEAQMAMLAMIVRGVFERFPRLRVAYMEANCAWLPWWLWRMEEHVELSGWKEAPECTRSPREYFERNCYVSVEPDEHLVHHVIEELGDAKIVWESDYPHPDSKYPEAVSTFLALPKVSDESKRRILWDNAVDLYRFPPELMPKEFREARTPREAG